MFKTGIVLIIILLSGCRKSNVISPEFYSCTLNFNDSSSTNPNNSKYLELINGMVSKGVVGVNLAVHISNSGLWLGAAGKADIFNNIDMRPCHISRFGSTIKMITSTVLLKLAEEGKISLDDKISDFIPAGILKDLNNADVATIRQLLQHSSGIYNYIQDLRFQTESLNDLVREWKPEDLLHFAYNRKAYFKPDEDVRYSNTGYILLGLLIESIEGKPLYKVFEDRIFDPLHMNLTSFAAKDPVPAGIARGYVDLYSDFRVIESTYFSGWDYYTADGGLISTPYDMHIFFRALMDGSIIDDESLNFMLSWKFPSTTDADFYPIAYGLGIFKIETSKGIAYMHSGDAIGYYANMLYFPDDSTSVVYAVNSNYGKIDEFVSTKTAMQKIIDVIRN